MKRPIKNKIHPSPKEFREDYANINRVFI